MFGGILIGVDLIQNISEICEDVSIVELNNPKNFFLLENYTFEGECDLIDLLKCFAGEFERDVIYRVTSSSFCKFATQVEGEKYFSQK